MIQDTKGSFTEYTSGTMCAGTLTAGSANRCVSNKTRLQLEALTNAEYAMRTSRINAYKSRLSLRLFKWEDIDGSSGEHVITVTRKGVTVTHKRSCAPLKNSPPTSITKLASRSGSDASSFVNRTSSWSFSTPSIAKPNRSSHVLSSSSCDACVLSVARSLFFSVRVFQ
jgi:hypothetical protein